MLKMHSIVWGVTDIPRVVAFWCAALNYRLKRPADADWAILVPAEGEGFQLSLKLVSSPKAHRHHMDLISDCVAFDVDRLVQLGAAKVHWRYEDGADYVVLADPDGNRFCVCHG